MGAKQKRHPTECPIAFALDVFGDRWSLLIVRDVLFKGRRTYQEFLDAGEGIATNVLADRLKRLQRAGILLKKRSKEDARAFEYELTPRGLDLLPVLLEMIRWSAVHDPETPLTKAFARSIEKDRDAVAEKMLREYRELRR
jgi:DNA-binding HxlR family transcriptional regulator